MVTMTSADQALKSLYLGVVTEQLNTGINPLLARIRQSSEGVWGKEVRKLAQYGVNGGVGAGTEDGALPAAAGNNYEQFVLTLKNLYGTIEISDKAMRASENSAGAFVNLLNAEMEGLVKAASFNFGRMLFGDGTGKLATTVKCLAGVFTMDSVKNLAEGMVVDFRNSSGAVIEGAAGRRILSVDRSSKGVLVDGGALNETLVPAGSILTVQGSYGQELTGLSAIFRSVGKLYGVDRAKNKWMVPYIKQNVGEITEEVLQAAIDELDEGADSQVDFIVCSAGVKRAFQKHLTTYKRNVDVMNLEGGYRALSYNGIPIISDRFCPEGTMFLLSTKDFTLHQLCDWKWLEGEDGKVIRQMTGRPVYTATLVKYADLMCAKPCGQAMLSGITEA